MRIFFSCSSSLNLRSKFEDLFKKTSRDPRRFASRMKCALLSVIFFSSPAFAFENADLVVKTFDEKNFDLKDFRGKKNALVVFWAQWCADCIRKMPEVEELHKTCRAKVEVIGVTVDRRRDKEKVLERIKNVTYPNAFFSDADENFPSFTVVPTLYLVDKNGAAQEIKEVPTCSQLK